MSEELQYADDMVSLFIKYDHIDQLTKFLKENVVYLSTLEKILEFGIKSDNDNLLIQIGDILSKRWGNSKDTDFTYIYTLIYSKKIEVLKSYLEKSPIFDGDMYVASYNIGFVEFFNEFLNEKCLKTFIHLDNETDNILDVFFQKHFQTYKYGTLPDIRSVCDLFFRNNEDLKIYTQEKSADTVDESLAKMLLRLKHDEEFKNNTMKCMVDVYHFVNENKEYFNLQ